MTICDLIFFDAGGGHRSAANSLRSVIQTEGYPWELRNVNLQELLDPVDLVRRITGVRVQDIYNRILNRGWTAATRQLNTVLHAAIRLYHERQVDLLESHWRRNLPDIVVSLVPHFNRALLQSLRRVSRSVPFVTVMTDIADYPPHFWIEPQDQYLVCGSRRALEQALSLGIPEEKIYLTSGMMINPRFYEPIVDDRDVIRTRLDLSPGLPTVLVMFGGQGSTCMREIMARLDECSIPLQAIYICGRNERLDRELHAMGVGHPRHISGFTTEVPLYMHASDVFIGKPGPGAISEAIQMRLPVIVERNCRTMPQEWYNAQWIIEQRLGIVLKDFRRIGRALDQMLEPGLYRQFKANVAATKNRAVFEVPAILRDIISRTVIRRAASA